MKKTSIMGIVLIFIMFAGCEPRPCINSNLNPVFVGFTSPNIDTIIVRAYQPNDSFNYLLDTIIIPTAYGVRHDDSLYLDFRGYNTKRGYPELSPSYDWEIYIPSINKVITISQIISQQTTTSAWKRDCRNPIQSCIQDGQLVYVPYVT